NYALSASPAAVVAQAGGSGLTTVSIARTNFTGAVTLSLDAPPSGVTASFNPASPTGNTSDATISAAASVAPGDYTVTIKGSASGPGDKTTTITLTVTAAANYTLAVNPAVLTVQAGAQGAATVTIARTNFNGAVTLSLSSPPSGVSGAFNPASPTGDMSALTLTVDNTVVPGDYTITVMGTATGVPTKLRSVATGGTSDGEIAAAAGDRTATFQLTVTAASGISLSAGPATVAALQGGIAMSTVTITRASFAGDVNLAASGLPAGMTVSFSPNDTPDDASVATVLVGAGVPVGNHPVTITGSGSGAADATTTLTVGVSAPPAIFNTELQFAGTVVPEFFGFQDGTGAWQAVLPLYASGTGTYSYRMNMASGFGGLYYVFNNAGLTATIQALQRSGLIGPEDLLGELSSGSGFIAGRLRQAAASMAPTFGSTGYLTVNSYGTPSELNALGAYFAPMSKIDVIGGVINGLPRTNIWVGGRHAAYDGSQSTVIIPAVNPGRLQYGLVAGRFNTGGILDAVHVKSTAGTANTMDMQGSGSASPLFTQVFTGTPLGSIGFFTHLWNGPSFVGVVDMQSPNATTPKNAGAPQLSQWGPNGVMGITVYDTDELTFKRKFTGGETNWGLKSTFFPALLDPQVTNGNGYTVNFNAPTEFGLPFQGFAGAIIPSTFMGNAIVGTATRTYFQMSGQSGPSYSLQYLPPAAVGAPTGSALGSDNIGIFGVTKSVSVQADGLAPLMMPNAFHLQSFRLLSVGYP
ncbi:MAG TPA: hypothetical protein VF981_07405, partial [Gemmatimonadaceae bacterium]